MYHNFPTLCITELEKGRSEATFEYLYMKVTHFGTDLLQQPLLLKVADSSFTPLCQSHLTVTVIWVVRMPKEKETLM